MPEVSGLDVLKQFRFADTSGNTPVIMLSADALPETIRQCREAGANDYLTKPVEVARLLKAVAQYSSPDTEKNQQEKVILTQKPNPSEDILDADRLEELAWICDSPEKFEKFIALFEESGEKHIATLKASADHEDRSAFAIAAHTFKGSASTMGLKQVDEPYRAIEAHKTTLSKAEMQRYAAQFARIYREGDTALQEYAAEMRAKSDI